MDAPAPEQTTRTQRDGPTVRALDLLDLVAQSRRPPRYAEIQRESGLSKATVHRLLKLMVEERMLRVNDGEYRLGSRLLTMAHAAWRDASIAEVARAALDSLSTAVGETIHLAQLDDAQVLYIDKRLSNRSTEMYSGVGKVGPAYCTGVGKAMLAQLDESALTDALSKQSFHRYTGKTICSADAMRKEIGMIRKDGIAWDLGEHEDGITCLAAPIIAAGAPLAALSITTSRRDKAWLETKKPALLNATATIATAAETAFAPVR